MALAAGTRIGPYEIVDLVGAGGMGEVYRARDPRLGRDVAIKVLPERFAQSADRLRRFEREARAVAALTHPNVLTIFDVGSQEGAPFLVTELLEGETLQAFLRRERPSVRQSLSWMVQVAHGVACAHDAGILHRDLKPANLFLTRDGRVKILDFGVAKLAQPGEGASDGSTATGSLVGTAAYMSPEQIRDEPLDARCDIFAMGAILYELVAGRPAFEGPSSSDVMASILRDEPRSFAALGAQLPVAVEGLIRRCLEKRREGRFGSARELAAAMETVLADRSLPAAIPGPANAEAKRRRLVATPRSKAVLALLAVAAFALAASGAWRNPKEGTSKEANATAVTPASPRPVKVVVLPFENLGAPADAYFATGLTDEITSLLASVNGLSVIARTTAMAYDRKGKTIAQIGADLSVDYVLEGTVSWERRGGNESRVRVAPALMRVADETHLWGDRYDRRFADIFAIQSEVAKSAIAMIGVKLKAGEMSALDGARTSDMEAYDFYLRGLAFARRGQGKEEFDGAIEMFQSAVDRDPRFTPALAQLLKARAGIYFYHYDRDPRHAENARETLERLSALAPDAPEAHTARGYYDYWVRLDYATALRHFERARSLRPADGEVLEGIAFILKRQGRWEESAQVSAQVLEIDPESPHALFQHGLTCVLLRRYDEAERVFASASRKNPPFANAWALQVRSRLLARGDAAAAQQIVDRARRVARLNDAAGLLANEAFRVALVRRDFEAALNEADRGMPTTTQFFYQPMDLFRAYVYRLQGHDHLARASFQKTRTQLEKMIEEAANDPDSSSRYYSSLGIALAALGLRDEALAAARRGTELVPPARDAWRATARLHDLALVHSMLGQQDEAITLLDDLLSRTGEISTHILRLDPRWQGLKSSPRFEALLAKHGDPR